MAGDTVMVNSMVATGAVSRSHPSTTVVRSAKCCVSDAVDEFRTVGLSVVITSGLLVVKNDKNHCH